MMTRRLPSAHLYPPIRAGPWAGAAFCAVDQGAHGSCPPTTLPLALSILAWTSELIGRRAGSHRGFCRSSARAVGKVAVPWSVIREGTALTSAALGESETSEHGTSRSIG